MAAVSMVFDWIIKKANRVCNDNVMYIVDEESE